MKLYTFDWVMIGFWTPVTVVLITLAYRRVKRDALIHHEMKVHFRRWLSQFDDPNTGD